MHGCGLLCVESVSVDQKSVIGCWAWFCWRFSGCPHVRYRQALRPHGCVRCIQSVTPRCAFAKNVCVVKVVFLLVAIRAVHSPSRILIDVVAAALHRLCARVIVLKFGGPALIKTVLIYQQLGPTHVVEKPVTGTSFLLQCMTFQHIVLECHDWFPCHHASLLN
jgi:hypothetical protein